MRGLLIWFSIIVVLAYMVGGIAYYIEKKAIKENKSVAEIIETLLSEYLKK